MVHDYSYPSVYFAYFVFFLFVAVALYFLVRSARHGYWGKNSEEVKFRMLDED
jgi:hypothetical protein